jgi:polysaccharide export outer membrane protein
MKNQGIPGRSRRAAGRAALAAMLFAALAAAGLAGCSTTDARMVNRAAMTWKRHSPETDNDRQLIANTYQMLTDRGENYRIGGGDMLEISIYELEKRNEFKTVTVRVEESGEISLPVIGVINTLDLTVVDIEEKIVKALQDIDFILSPRVSVVINEYESKKIAVLGAVTEPGWYSIRNNVTTLWEALSMAGGPTEEAGYELQVHGPDGGMVTIDLIQLMETGNKRLNMVLHHGNVINVPKAKKFYVWGFVNKPGGFPLNRPMTVLEGIAEAGGLIPKEASPRCTFLKRIENEREEDIPLDLVAIASGEHPNIFLQPDDVIEVRQTTGRLIALELLDFIKRVFYFGYNLNPESR